jgi:uncharacterized delta-60 repeat protein
MFHPQLEVLEDRCLLSAGALDPTFGSGGSESLSNFGAVRCLVVYPNTGMNPQTDGKIVVGGDIGKTDGSYQWALERFNTDGSVDKTFGTSGTGIVSSVLAGNGDGSEIFGLAIDSNRNLVAVGFATIPLKGQTNDQEIAVARNKGDGSLDPTFGSGTGFVLTNVIPNSKKSSGTENAFAVAIDANGNIDVCARVTPSTTNAPEFTLLRYNAHGTLDTSFGNQSPKNGISITAPFGGGGDNAFALALQPDGNILVSGSVGSTSIAVARYLGAGNLAGQLDTSFGSGGTVTLTPPGSQHSEATGIFVQSNSAIVLAISVQAGGTNADQTLMRLTSVGAVDLTFGNSGFASSTPGGGTRVAQGANGDLLVTADSTNGGVAAYLPDGSPDTTFGTSGLATTQFFSQYLAIQSDGKILIAGIPSNTPYVLARLLPSNTQVGFTTATPNPVSAGTNVMLTVSNISDNAYPITTVTQVSFYQDTNGNGVLDSGDTLLGPGTLNTSTGVWTFIFSTTGLHGTYTLFAQATDGSLLYDPVSIQVTVN